MTLRCLAALAGLIVLGFAGQAMAQVPMMGNLPGFDDAPPAPPPGAAPAPPMGAPPPGAQRGMASPPQQGGEPPCFRDFVPLRAEAEKRGKAIQAAGERKASRAEFCKLIRNFAVAEAKVVNFVTEN